MEQSEHSDCSDTLKEGAIDMKTRDQIIDEIFETKEKLELLEKELAKHDEEKVLKDIENDKLIF